MHAAVGWQALIERTPLCQRRVVAPGRSMHPRCRQPAVLGCSMGTPRAQASAQLLVTGDHPPAASCPLPCIIAGAAAAQPPPAQSAGAVGSGRPPVAVRWLYSAQAYDPVDLQCGDRLAISWDRGVHNLVQDETGGWLAAWEGGGRRASAATDPPVHAHLACMRCSVLLCGPAQRPACAARGWNGVRRPALLIACGSPCCWHPRPSSSVACCLPVALPQPTARPRARSCWRRAAGAPTPLWPRRTASTSSSAR